MLRRRDAKKFTVFFRIPPMRKRAPDGCGYACSLGQGLSMSSVAVCCCVPAFLLHLRIRAEAKQA
jgi:hypothetical protein